jgi:hypothetical protein
LPIDQFTNLPIKLIDQYVGRMLWIPAFAGMTEETDGFDESNPYIYIDRRDAYPTGLSYIL